MTLVMTWQMGKLSKRSPPRVQSKLTVINVLFSKLIFRPVLHVIAVHVIEKIMHTSPANQNRVFTRAMV